MPCLCVNTSHLATPQYPAVLFDVGLGGLGHLKGDVRYRFVIDTASLETV